MKYSVTNIDMKTTTKSELKLHGLLVLPQSMFLHGTLYQAERTAFHTNGEIDYIIYLANDGTSRILVANK